VQHNQIEQIGLQTTTNSQSPFRIAHNWAKLHSVMGSGSSYTCQALSSRMPSTANDRSPTVTASRAVFRTNQDPCCPWISSTWPSIYSLSIIHNVNQETSSKANGKLILLRYATHIGKRSSTCVAMVCSSIHVARPTSSLSLVPPALATFSCAFTRKAYELTTHFRLQPNGKA